MTSARIWGGGRRVYLVFFSHAENAAHVDFVECGKHSTGILSILESLGNSLSHSGHFDSTFFS